MEEQEVPSMTWMSEESNNDSKELLEEIAAPELVNIELEEVNLNEVA